MKPQQGPSQAAGETNRKIVTHMSKTVDLVVVWTIVIGYILLGGVALRTIELEEEVKQATDYCVKVTCSLKCP